MVLTFLWEFTEAGELCSSEELSGICWFWGNKQPALDWECVRSQYPSGLRGAQCFLKGEGRVRVLKVQERWCTLSNLEDPSVMLYEFWCLLCFILDSGSAYSGKIPRIRGKTKSIWGLGEANPAVHESCSWIQSKGISILNFWKMQGNGINIFWILGNLLQTKICCNFPVCEFLMFNRFSEADFGPCSISVSLIRCWFPYGAGELQSLVPKLWLTSLVDLLSTAALG